MCTHLDVFFSSMNSTINRQHDGHHEDTLPPIEGNAAWGQPQDLRYINMAHYDMPHPPVSPAASRIYPLNMLLSHQ
jgi:hypothetical protein